MGTGQHWTPIADRVGMTMVSEQRPKPLRSWMAATRGAGMAVSPLSAGIAVNRNIPCYYRPPAAPAQEKAAPQGRFFRRGPARYRNFRVYNLSPMRYNVRVCLGLLSKQRQTAPPPISAGMMELVDMRDLGSCVSNSTALPLKNPLSIDIARFFCGPLVLDFGGYFGVLSSVLSCHLVYPYGHLFPDVL